MSASKKRIAPAKKKAAKKIAAPKDAATRFLEFYYPIHYKAGVRVEDAMRGDELGRHQVAILWLIHSEGTDGTHMSRKDIEQHLRLWFDVSSAAITKALRAMATAPLNLLTQEESAHSGREKTVTLSPAGEAHVEAMIGRGDAFIRRIIETMTPEEINQGLHFFSRISDIVDELK
ncbi:MAG: DNA-binding MarR family transcriptional regulator [Parvibaculaceae bacterium]|jgi:DNA-binding MarR family transcriptional regulator